MTRAFRTIVTVASCFALGACSSVGTVNGFNIDQGRMGVQNAPAASLFCERNPWICILALAGTVGGVAAFIASRGGNNSHTHYMGPPV